MTAAHVMTMVRGTLSWIAEKDRETGGWVATCPHLRLIAWGKTKDDLEASMTEAADMTLSYLIEYDQVEFLETKGFSVERYHLVESHESTVTPMVNGTKSFVSEPALVC